MPFFLKYIHKLFSDIREIFMIYDGIQLYYMGSSCRLQNCFQSQRLSPLPSDDQTPMTQLVPSHYNRVILIAEMIKIGFN